MSVKCRIKRIRRVSFVFLIILLFGSVFCFASSDSDPSLLPNTPEVSEELSGSSSSRSSDLVLQDIKTETLRISASDTSGFHAVILGLLGDYNPIAVTTSYQYPSGQTYQTRYQVDVEPDWSWICTAAIFVVIIFCLFRLIGGLFAWKR